MVSQNFVINFAKRHTKDMDSVLEALRHYRLSATEKQKATDLNRLEKECLSTVDAYQYVYEMKVHDGHHSRQQELVNYNMNPDYNLDFSLYSLPYVNIRCICV